MVQRVTAVGWVETGDPDFYYSNLVINAATDGEWHFGVEGSVDGGSKPLRAQYAVFDNTQNDATVIVVAMWEFVIAAYARQTIKIMPGVSDVKVLIGAGTMEVTLTTHDPQIADYALKTITAAS